jgi:zinc protease
MQLKFSLSLLVLFFSPLILTSHVQATVPAKPQALNINLPVTRYQLKNGLTVILHEDHSVPLISYHTWYRVGSRDESEGVTGAAHMLEHMMFKGAKKYTGKDFDQVLHENGITNNAFTTADYTGFFENLPSSKLELMMDIEVDRMRFLAIRPEDLKSELQVVGEERRWRVDNNPGGLLRENFMSTLYEVHPYRWPVIGWMQDIQAYTSEKLRKFYDTFYVPNNAVLVLVGDFDTAKVRELIEKYYGKLEFRALPERKYPVEPAIKKSRYKEVEADVQSPTFLVGYPGVEAGHADSYALDLLSGVLGNGSSSRLHKRLVYEMQMASSAGSYNMTSANPGSFATMVTMIPGKSWKSARGLVEEEIRRLVQEPVSERELQKVKNQIMKDFVDGLTTVDGKANAFAVNEIVFGSYEKMYTDLEKYNAVTVSDLQRVAKLYLKASSQVVTVLLPKKAVKP